MKELILKIYWGGLGDHLLYSPIPRLAKQFYNYDKVFISNYSNYRNLETKHLVWELNPYVDGFVDKDADYPKFASVTNGSNILDEIAVFYGLYNAYDALNRPEVYYIPNNISNLNKAVIFEPNSINKSGVPTILQTKKYFNINKIKLTYQMEPLTKIEILDNIESIKVNSLLHLCDIVASCKMLYCYTTGIATLADAINKAVTVLYISGIKSMFHHSKIHSYINIG